MADHIRGTCRVCGLREDSPLPVLGWADESQTLCRSCVQVLEKMDAAEELDADALNELLHREVVAHLAQLRDEAVNALVRENVMRLRAERAEAERDDLKGRAERAEAEVERWKEASGLECGGDPDGVTPARAQRYWEQVEAECDSALARAKEVEALAAKIVSLEKCSIDEKESKLTIASRTLQGLLSAWGDLLIENKARNFLCVDFAHEELGVVHVTVQLDHGETPVQQRDRERVRAEKAEAELARLTTWHPASEPPEVGVCVLAHYRDGSSGFDYWSDESGWESGGTVTHWHELPPGPEVTP